MYDQDSRDPSLKAQDFLGQLTCTLADIVAAPGGVVEARLRPAGASGSSSSSSNQQRFTKGRLRVRSEEVSSNKDLAHFNIVGNKLDKKDFFG